MSEMSFSVECVRKCLLENGLVFTVRSYVYRDRLCEFNGRIYKRFLLKGIKCKEDLIEFVELSGFRDVVDWWNKIECFCKYKNKFLYLVVRPKKLDGGDTNA
jgi:hypothetical protein